MPHDLRSIASCHAKMLVADCCYWERAANRAVFCWTVHAGPEDHWAAAEVTDEPKIDMRSGPRQRCTGRHPQASAWGAWLHVLLMGRGEPARSASDTFRAAPRRARVPTCAQLTRRLAQPPAWCLGKQRSRRRMGARPDWSDRPGGHSRASTLLRRGLSGSFR